MPPRDSDADPSVPLPTGNLICKAGLVTGYACGTISSTKITRTVDVGITPQHQWVVTAFVDNGDSGGPVLYGSIAGGIISWRYTDDHDVDRFGFGTTAQTIARAWRPCYVSSC